MRVLTEKQEQRFYKKVKIMANGCHEWQGQLNFYGYGRVILEYCPHMAHRIAWMLHHKQEIPKGMLICHTCDNPKCVNPEHLFLGTPKDNMADKIAKGRQPRGPRTEPILPRRKQKGENGYRLSAEEAYLVHKLRQEGESVKNIANILVVTPEVIYRILSGKRYPEIYNQFYNS